MFKNKTCKQAVDYVCLTRLVFFPVITACEWAECDRGEGRNGNEDDVTVARFVMHLLAALWLRPKDASQREIRVEWVVWTSVSKMCDLCAVCGILRSHINVRTSCVNSYSSVAVDTVNCFQNVLHKKFRKFRSGKYLSRALWVIKPRL